jgi:methyl-accepting chemotaxis protein
MISTAHESTTEMQWSGTGALPRRGAGRPRHREPIPQPSGTLLNGLLVVFCIVTSLAVGMTVKSILELSHESTRKSIVKDVRAASGNMTENVSGSSLNIRTLVRYRDRLLILLALTVISFGAGIYVLVRRLRAPLQAIAAGAREIADGNLDVAVPEDRTDVFGGLGQAVNDIAANYQEVLLLTGTNAGKCSATVKKLVQVLKGEDTPASRAEVLQQLGLLDRELNEISEMIGSFDFYQVHFDGTKVFRESAAKKGRKHVT